MSDDQPPSTTGAAAPGFWSRLFGAGTPTGDERDDIRAFLSASADEGRLQAEEATMLQNVLEVAETRVRDIMVPRSHMVVLEQGDTLDVWLEKIIESGHSRFPVIGEGRDEVVGILLAKDLLRYFGEQRSGGSPDRARLLRPVVFIPESKRLNTLLSEFRESHNHIAIVVDEYGGVAGLATIEDVLEQIVGDIDDEHDPEEAEYIQSLDNGHYLVRALTRVEDFNEHFTVELSDEEYDTIGGLVIHELGRLPRRGETLEFAGFNFKVTRADRRRVDTLEVSRSAESAT